MRSKNPQPLLAIAASFLLTGAFSSTSMAETVPGDSGSIVLAQLLKTDSRGSYSYAEDKKEGSKSSSKPSVGKGEGSGSKKYAPSKHGYRHGKYMRKKKGGGGREYSHGASHKGERRYSSGGHGGGHGKNPFKHVLCFTEKLGLTEAQIKQIKSGEFDFKKSEIRAKADHAIAHMELDRLVHAENIDESKIRSVGDRISEIRSGKVRAMIEAKIAILKILTAEQRKKMNNKHSAR